MQNKMGKKKKTKIVYYEDKGEAIYPMSFLDGLTPEEAEELEKKKKNRPTVTGKERWAMLRAAITVYAPPVLCAIIAFGLTALLLYLFLK